MEKIDILIFGIIQGLSEFLPVSSSGHIFLAEYFLKSFNQDFLILISLWLHLATLLAVLFYFKKGILELLRAGFYLKKNTEKNLLFKKLFFATFVTSILGIIILKFFEIKTSLLFLAISFVIGGIFILLSEKISLSENKNLSWFKTFFLGLAQGISVIPGISRSGFTISTLMISGIEKKEAAKISFLLSVPTIIGASFFITFDFFKNNLLNFNYFFSDFFFIFILGILPAFFLAYFSIFIIMKFVEKNWKYFGYYNLILGIFLILFLI